MPQCSLEPFETDLPFHVLRFDWSFSFPDPLSPFHQLVVPGEFSMAFTNICKSYTPMQTVLL